jgi:hypothetical protein
MVVQDLKETIHEVVCISKDSLGALSLTIPVQRNARPNLSLEDNELFTHDSYNKITSLKGSSS